MVYFPDQAECDYFGVECARQLRAVGWLSCDHDYPVGKSDKKVFDRLVVWSEAPWQPVVTVGVHSCDLCQFEGAVGSRILFVPDRNYAWICPELIGHYINAHRYQPPEEFCRAVLAAPEMKSMAYLKAIRDAAPALIHVGRQSPH